MGGILSRKKGKESFPELLASLTKDISSLESQQNRLHQQHRLLALFTFLSLVGYVALVGGYIFYIGAPKTPLHIGICLGSLVAIWLLRWVFKWVISNRAKTCESRLAELRDQKKDVLSRVMDEVPYKTAKELLEKYDPQSPHLRAPQQGQQQQQQHQQQQPVSAGTGAEGVRQRRPEGGAGGRPLAQSQQLQHQQQLFDQQQRLQHQQMIIANQERRLRAQQERLRQIAASGEGQANLPPPEPLPVYELKPGDVAGPAPGPPRPQPILPRDRTSVDKVVEFLVGDGPNNRYALICKHCHSHNGMVQPSEFDYCAFRCAYCYELNPARKQMGSSAPAQMPSSAPGQSQDQSTLLELDTAVNGDDCGADNGAGNGNEDASQSVPEEEDSAPVVQDDTESADVPSGSGEPES